MPKLNPLHIFNQVISSGGETGGRGSGVRGRQRKGPGAMAEENMRLSLPHRLAQSTAISHLSFYFFLFPCGSGRNKLGRRSRGEKPYSVGVYLSTNRKWKWHHIRVYFMLLTLCSLVHYWTAKLRFSKHIMPKEFGFSEWLRQNN